MTSESLTLRDEWVEATMVRLHRRARQLLGQFADVRRWEESGDLLQETYLRILKLLRHMPCASELDFLRLSSRNMRWALLDAARRQRSKYGFAANHQSLHGADPAMLALSPYRESVANLEKWSNFQRAIRRLPPPQRDVFELKWYHELTYVRIGELLGFSERMARIHWAKAQTMLHDAVRGQLPDHED
jgi:RNA polymerase sigma factor (sigma-70 family)